MQYVSLAPLRKNNAQYYILIGERSNGKTFCVLEEILANAQKGKQGAIIRRYRDDLDKRRGLEMWSALIEKDLVSKYTGGKWNDITYISRAWYFSRYDKELDRVVIDNAPFCFGFALSSMEHDKSTAYPNVTTILFDEFISVVGGYMYEEFITFQNVLSTIIRDRDNVTIYMCGNTTDKYANPYFTEMGLTNISKMKKGDIDIYEYGDSGLKVCVYFTDTPSKKGKKSDKYFAFGNDKLKMVTNGSWAIDIYPHLDMGIKIKSSDIVFTYFIKYHNYLLQADIVHFEDKRFTFIHNKTTPIKNEDSDIIYSLEYSTKRNYHRDLLARNTKLEQKISKYFLLDKVFYQNNEIGEIVKAYKSQI